MQGVVTSVTFFATPRKLSGRNEKRSALPDHQERRPQTQNKERKSYYEKQKKHPDLHRRCTLHPRDLCEFVAGGARALRRDGPTHQPIELSNAASRQANVRRVRPHWPARHLLGGWLGSHGHGRRPPGPA